MSRIIIVDDHPVVRLGVRLMLEKEGYSVVAECDSGTACIQAVREHAPDLLILDLAIPKIDGFAVISHLKATGQNVKILVLTSSNAYNAMRCLQAGAAGFVCKDDNLAEMVGAARAVLSGYTYFPESTLLQLQESGVSASEEHVLAGLTDREVSVLRMLARGMRNQEIAKDLMLSHKTVSTYRVRLMSKLNVPNFVALVEFAKRNGIA
ncbi:LuxR family transcriptional regulator [Burkholderia aenigmatica]|uniref:LuxR family transcriptional regulator n=1 Tax=Burkholderia aenigmatica TaxID=2015348 RepID=A0A6P2RJN5_9BURK|nr:MULTISPECIES: response regulator transcription factor [Burkholderia]MDN7515182.1 response regulator transcription factor [Burkholderia sp. AU45251]VWC35387.1 LuxR family transcriptional regulator [Burkholderia aenigmatica]HDR9482182.1 response regulator transcription factor [Burkholderia aenigmatica]HDR9515649.1 response regulator transcription factor [Burkholderia aenigmatica]HDR9590553.1 response regulator transcription factor [Burkholderia aenigmatica]